MRTFHPLEILKIYKDKNYPIRNEVGSINIFGVRNSDLEANTFDDTVGLIWKIDQNNWMMKQYNATTDPGLYFREHPMNPEGTAIIVPGFYKEVYKVGLHTGYEAMEQIAPIEYVRDNNKNKILDLLYKIPGFKSKKELGKTNIHHAGSNSTLVDNWSAGCQVIAKLTDFLEFMRLVKDTKQFKELNKFDYTLFEIEDFPV